MFQSAYDSTPKALYSKAQGRGADAHTGQAIQFRSYAERVTQWWKDANCVTPLA